MLCPGQNETPGMRKHKYPGAAALPARLLPHQGRGREKQRARQRAWCFASFSMSVPSKNGLSCGSASSFWYIRSAAACTAGLPPRRW